MTILVTDLASPARLSAVVPTLLGFAAKATAVLALGMVGAMLARGASAATRHMIWVLALGGALVVPLAASLMPHWELPLPRWARHVAIPSTDAIVISPAVSGASSNAVLSLAPRDESNPPTIAAAHAPRSHSETVSSTTTISGTAGGARASTSASFSRSVTRDVPAAHAVASGEPPAWRRSLGFGAVLVWLAGAAAALLPTVVGMLRLRAIGRRARVMSGGRWALLAPSAMRELDVRRRVRFVEVDDAVMPMTWGVFRPVVLLPAGDFDSTIEQWLDVLRHELAHVRRYDCLTQLIGQIACAIHWFNPLAWIAARQMRIERERACDDEVLRAGARASAYADYLLRVARAHSVVGAAALGGLAMARPSQMAGRLLAVLDERRRRGRITARMMRHAVAVAGSVVVTVGSITPVPADARIVIPVIAGQRITATGGIAVSTVPAAQVAPWPRLAVPTISEPDIGAAPRIEATAPAEPAAPAPTLLQAAAPCDRTTGGRNSASHMSSTSGDNGSKRWRVMWSEGDCSYEIDARGEIRFNRDVTDIESISSGGSFTIEEHRGDDTRRLVIRSGADGTLERTYSVNGARQEYDAAARAWFADALIALDRRTGFAVDQRVPAILDRAGVDGVLQEITLVESDYARRRYYTKLLSLRRLDAAQVRRVLEQAGTSISSDYELAELLVALAKLDAFDESSYPAFVAASRSIGSDYEHRRALSAMIARGGLTPTVTRALLEDARRIESDYELTELLVQVASKGMLDSTTRDAYFAAADQIGSDYERHRALKPLLKRDVLTKDIARSVLASAAKIESDYECASLLVEVANAITIDDELRPAFEKAADTIEAQYEYSRAISAVRRRVTR